MEIKATHLIDEGAYLIERAWGMNLEVDGLPAPTQDFMVPSLDCIVQVETHAGAVIAREDAEGNQLDEGEFQAKQAELLAGSTQDEDMNRVFPSLDAEFEWRKFAARWTKVVRNPPTVTRKPVNAVVTEVRVRSGDPEIVSLWNAPSAQHDKRLYRMSRDAVMLRTAREMCAEGGVSIEIPGHSGLRFAQIEGKYAFNDSFNASDRPFIGTLEQCRAEKEQSVKRVADIVRAHIAQKKGVALRNAGETVIALRAVRQSLVGVRAKQDSAGSLRVATKALSDLITALEAEIAA